MQSQMFKDIKADKAQQAKKKGKKEAAPAKGIQPKARAVAEDKPKNKKNRKERRKDQRKERRRDIKKRVKEEKLKLQADIVESKDE